MNERDDTLRRIQDKRARCVALGRGTRHHRDDFEHVWHPPPIPLAELERIEGYFDLRLPEEYRRYVNEVANGGMGPTSYPMESALGAILGGIYRERTFVLERPRVNGFTADEIEVNRRQLVLTGLISEDMSVSQFDTGPMPKDVYPSDGTLFIGQSGCGLDELLVLRGPRRGEVWHDGDAGSVRREMSFLPFMETWLDAELGRAMPSRQATLEFRDAGLVRRIHHRIWTLANLFDQLHQLRLKEGSASEWTRERDTILASGVIAWDLRCVLGEVEAAAPRMRDASPIHNALAAFYFELRQDPQALAEVRRANNSDALLHARILISLGQNEEAEPLLRAVLKRAVPEELSESELWYDGEVAEYKRAFLAEESPSSCVAQRAVALRYLGDHAEAIALCEEHLDAGNDWPRFELAANHEMCGRRERAIEYVRSAFRKSYADPARLTRDPAWADFAESAEFEALAKAYHAQDEP